MKTQNNRIVILDGNSILHRAYHALPFLTSPTGETVGGVFGFTNILLKIVNDLQPDQIFVAWDTSHPTFRHTQFIDYKGKRPETPADLKQQMKQIKELLIAFGVDQYELAGYEADDVIATIAAKSIEAGVKEVKIVSGEMDFLQLVNENIQVVTNQKGFSDIKIYDREAVIERFNGLAPEQVVDYKALRGDTSDNIPGIKGIGEKTAINLLNRYKTLDELYANLDELSPKEAKLLAEGRESAYMSRELARINPATPIDFKLAEDRWAYDAEALHKMFIKLGFKSLLNRINSSKETTVGATGQEGEPIAGRLEVIRVEKAAGTKQSELADFRLACYLITGLSGKQLELENLAMHYLGLQLSTDELNDEARELFNWKISSEISKELNQPELSEIKKLYDEVELPLKKILDVMHEYGVLVNRGLLEKKLIDTEKKIEEMKLTIYKTLGHEFNINSPKQLGDILFDELKLPVLKKTKTGRSTDESVLLQLKGLHPLVDQVLTYRQCFKIKSTYLEPFPKLLDDQNRLHTIYNQTQAASGRLSSENPNLQNIPVDLDWGLRQIFIAPPGRLLLVADYSQIELRLMAHISGDAALLEAFQKGTDIHAATAAGIFNKPLAEVKTFERKIGKTMNFALMYGISAHGLSESLGVDIPTAQSYINAFVKQYPELMNWQKETVELVKEKGYVETLYGRRRNLPEIRSSNMHIRKAAERIAINHPLQGTQADLIKMAMVRIIEKSKTLKLEKYFQMVLQVHDELVFEVDGAKIGELSMLVKTEMESVASLKVPIEVDIKVGPNWQDTEMIT
jgi:DNA polymerase-1